MTKEELEIYKKKEDQLPWETIAESGFGLVDAHILADIAYQLTRIADQGEPTRIVFADKPAPDVGLVDLLREAQSYIRTTLPKWAKAEDLPPIMHKLAKALDAHKPEVE